MCGAIAKCAYQFEWHVVDTNAAAVPDTLFQTTGTHTNYVIFAEPVAPWSNIYGVSSNAWATALAFVITTNACEGATTETEALARLTQSLFSIRAGGVNIPDEPTEPPSP